MRRWLILPVLITSGTLLLAQQPGSAVLPGGTNPVGPAPVKEAPSPASSAPTAKLTLSTDTPGPTDAANRKDLLAFDPQRAELRWSNGRWALQAGTVSLRDFGTRDEDAREALNIIRRLHLNQRGTIGHPVPIMEYWLADGLAPQAMSGGQHIYPIDRATLRAEAIQGQWCVLDNHRVFFNFGPLEQDAQQALNVIRKHGFDQVGYVGSSQPSMIYFVAGHAGAVATSLHSPSIETASIPHPNIPAAAPVQPGPPAQPGASTELKKDSPAYALLVRQAQLAARGSFQLAPPPSASGTRLRFDPHEATVRNEDGQWKLYGGQYVLGNFGSDDQQAHLALQMVKYYGCTEQCVVGLPEPTFRYFLVNGHAPMGMYHILKGHLIQTDKISAQQHQNDWYVCEGNKPLLFFGNRRADAQEMASAIKRYHFDCISQLGPPDHPALSFLVRTR